MKNTKLSSLLFSIYFSKFGEHLPSIILIVQCNNMNSVKDHKTINAIKSSEKPGPGTEPTLFAPSIRFQRFKRTKSIREVKKQLIIIFLIVMLTLKWISLKKSPKFAILSKIIHHQTLKLCFPFFLLAVVRSLLIEDYGNHWFKSQLASP